MAGEYTEDNIKSLTWQEHIRARAGMYIGKLGDGSMADDGPYVLLKEVIDNSVDEFVMGAGKKNHHPHFGRWPVRGARLRARDSAG